MNAREILALGAALIFAGGASTWAVAGSKPDVDLPPAPSLSSTSSWTPVKKSSSSSTSSSSTSSSSTTEEAPPEEEVPQEGQPTEEQAPVEPTEEQPPVEGQVEPDPQSTDGVNEAPETDVAPPG